jgi:hypothetical protein
MSGLLSEGSNAVAEMSTYQASFDAGGSYSPRRYTGAFAEPEQPVCTRLALILRIE